MAGPELRGNETAAPALTDDGLKESEGWCGGPATWILNGEESEGEGREQGGWSGVFGFVEL